MLRLAVVLGLAVFGSTASAADVPSGEIASGGLLRPFSGRSGATKEKLIVVGCAKPESEEASANSVASELAALVRDVKEKIIADLLRKLADGGSSDWLSRGPKSKKEIDELMKQLPPKYHAMVKEYFEKLEKMQNDKK